MSLRTVFALLSEAVLLIMVMGTDIKEFLILAVCLGGLLLLSLFTVLWAAFFLRIRCFCDNATCEREKNIKFFLNIKGFLLLPVVCKITLRTPYKEKRKSTIPVYSNIAADIFKTDRHFDFTAECPRSGNWDIGIKRFKVCDIFGFFSLPLFFSPKKNWTVKISVTPKFYPQARYAEILGGVDDYSGISFGNSELGEVFDDNRAYRYGDSLRRINWKQSAKLGKPVTRLYEKPKKSRIFIALDYYTTEIWGRSDDIYRETALFIAEYYAGQKNDVTVCLLRPENLRPELNCNDITDLSYLALGLADLSFKKDASALTDIPLKDFEFDDRDCLFIITSNPHSSLIDTAEIMSNQGMYVALIAPKTPALSEQLKSPYLTVLNDSEEISEKAGVVLC